MGLTKRKLLAGFSSLLGWTGITPVFAALKPTPRQTEGPFYPRAEDLLDDRDNDLVKVASRVTEAGGEILHLEGVLKDTSGRLLAGARVEIWQCDANGRYLHGADRAVAKPRDGGFQGFGATVSDNDGRFSFRTIKPVSYPGRTPHIHAKLFHPDNGSVLTTQFYVSGDPGNDRDGLYRRLSKAQRASLSMKLDLNGAGEWQTNVETVL